MRDAKPYEMKELGDIAIEANQVESEAEFLLTTSTSPEGSENECNDKLAERKRRSTSNGALAALSCMILSECLSETIVYPFAPFMITHFQVTDEPTKIG